MTKRTCSIDGCDREFTARNMCTLHYKRWRKYGDPHQSAYNRQHQNLPVEEAFEMLRGEPTETGCIEWQGYAIGPGYGQLMRGGVKILVHRLAYELAFGPIPDGLIVRHTCDNRKCTNPDHLITGTRGDNAVDAFERDRHRAGVAHHAAKMTEESVRELRRMRESGMTYQGLADHFGLSFSQARAIARREAWRRVP